ncbi:HD domain-containing protein [Microbacterium aurantiacum]|uniref:HD domain-containing protein n=1 Tax=Microbacterium aurantiacum TaxID=162393 RepID=A0ABT8FWG9_9MICO|nr:HD domain-containing protein [Microbacterium aurantiacum]MDN4465520.1 HD domain-containing protein [Microbacterium aurantiacum]
MSSPTSTRLGRDIRAHIPPASDVPGVVALRDADAEVWALAAPHLAVRNNDSHTLYAYGIARALLPLVPDAEPEVVLPAILLHDTGWSTVQDALILEAIAPGGGRPDLVRQHEVEGARIATEVLTALRRDSDVIEGVVAIIDGHDSRLTAESASDAVVKDADKLWRVTPHGNRIVSDWFGLTPDEAVRLTTARVHDALFTEPARAMARVLSAIASIDLIPERRGLT